MKNIKNNNTVLNGEPLGLSVKQNAKLEKALLLIEKALKKDPQDAEAWFHKGLCLDKLGRNQEASECFEKANQYTLQTTFDFYE